jgi:hypothetical protein
MGFMLPSIVEKNLPFSMNENYWGQSATVGVVLESEKPVKKKPPDKEEVSSEGERDPDG